MEYVLPLAASVLEADPLAGEMYDGELLRAFSSVGVEFWRKHAELKPRIQAVLERAVLLTADDDLAAEFLYLRGRLAG